MEYKVNVKRLGSQLGVFLVFGVLLAVPESAFGERVRTRTEVKPKAPAATFQYRFRMPRNKAEINRFRSQETMAREILRDRIYQRDTNQFLGFLRTEVAEKAPTAEKAEHTRIETEIRDLVRRVETAAARGETAEVGRLIEQIEAKKVEALALAKKGNSKLLTEVLKNDGEFYLTGAPSGTTSPTAARTEAARVAETKDHDSRSQIVEAEAREVERAGRIDGTLLARSYSELKTEAAGLGEVREGKTMKEAIRDMDADAVAENLVENHAFMKNMVSAFRSIGILDGKGDVKTEMREVLRAVMRNRSDMPIAHLMELLETYKNGDAVTKESIMQSLKGMGRLASLDRKLHDAASKKSDAEMVAHLEAMIKVLEKTDPQLARELRAQLEASKGDKDAIAKLWVKQLTREYVSYGNEFREMMDKDGTKGEHFKDWLSGKLVGKYKVIEKDLWKSLEKGQCWV